MSRMCLLQSWQRRRFFPIRIRTNICGLSTVPQRRGLIITILASLVLYRTSMDIVYHTCSPCQKHSDIYHVSNLYILLNLGSPHAVDILRGVPHHLSMPNLCSSFRLDSYSCSHISFESKHYLLRPYEYFHAFITDASEGISSSTFSVCSSESS